MLVRLEVRKMSLVKPVEHGCGGTLLGIPVLNETGITHLLRNGALVGVSYILWFAAIIDTI